VTDSPLALYDSSVFACAGVYHVISRRARASGLGNTRGGAMRHPQRCRGNLKMRKGSSWYRAAPFDANNYPNVEVQRSPLRRTTFLWRRKFFQMHRPGHFTYLQGVDNRMSIDVFSTECDGVQLLESRNIDRAAHKGRALFGSATSAGKPQTCNQLTAYDAPCQAARSPVYMALSKNTCHRMGVANRISNVK